MYMLTWVFNSKATFVEHVWVFVSVCVFRRETEEGVSACVCECVCVCISGCACVCVCVSSREHQHVKYNACERVVSKRAFIGDSASDRKCLIVRLLPSTYFSLFKKGFAAASEPIVFLQSVVWQQPWNLSDSDINQNVTCDEHLPPSPRFFLDRSVDVPLCRTPQIILQLFAKKWKQLNQRDKCNN